MITASFVVRNEANRWFDSVLAHTVEFVDRIFVYDDRSTDETLDIAFQYTSDVVQRGEDEASFMDHEGKFRLNALHALQSTVQPTENDWILALDADEFYVAKGHVNEETSLRQSISWCEGGKVRASSMDLHIGEIWDILGVNPRLRMDGFWAKNSAPRLYRWQDDPVFINKEMGCGSVPTYALKSPKKGVSIASILHFGYALDADKAAKFDRYRSMKNHGHNPTHIDSIMHAPKLMEYHGRTPKFWLGNHE